MSSGLWRPAYVAVGSNLENPLLQVRTALNRLSDIRQSRVIASSRLYRSRPLGHADQPDFVNAVAGMLTQLSSADFLQAMLDLELAAGRPLSREKWSPRILDLDLLVFGSERSNLPDLQIPHPGIAHRHFVLFPLRDIAPALDIPGVGSVSGAAARVASAGIEVLQ